MGTKNNPGEFDCYAKALPDEPLFVLLGRDPNAPKYIQDWARDRELDIVRGLRPETDRTMVVEARQCAMDMFAWRAKNEGVWRRPQTIQPSATDMLIAADAIIAEMHVDTTMLTPMERIMLRQLRHTRQILANVLVQRADFNSAIQDSTSTAEKLCEEINAMFEALADWTYKNITHKSVAVA